MWVVAPGLISFGFAGILAIVLVVRRVWYWKQPAALMIAYVLVPVVLSGLFYWCSDYIGVDVIETYILASIFGVFSILFVACLLEAIICFGWVLEFGHHTYY